MRKHLLHFILLLSIMLYEPFTSYGNNHSDNFLKSLLIPSPAASAYPNPACEGSNVSLFASGGFAYTWSGPGGFSSNLSSPVINNIQLSQEGNYTVTITTGSGDVTKSVYVRVDLKNVPDLPDIIGCAGQLIPQINIPGATAYNPVIWTNNNTNVGLFSSGENVIPAFTLTNSGSTQITANVHLDGKSNLTPTLPLVFELYDRQSTFSNIQLNGGTNYIEVDPGAAINLTGNVNIVNTGGYCPGCLFQFYLGIGSTSTTVYCYSGLNTNLPYSSTLNANFTAPTTPGYYYISADLTLDYGCITRNFVQNPSKSAALIKVRPAPIAPNASLTFNVADKQVSITNPKLNSGTNQLIVAPGASVNLSYDIAYTQVNNNFCQNQCIVQTYSGIGGSNTTIACTSQLGNYSGSISQSFTAPTTPGKYYIVVNSSIDYDCVPQSFSNSPDYSIAVLDVTDGTRCTPVPMDFSITVKPSPNAVATPSSQTICSGSAITSIAFSGNVSGTTYNWTRDNTGNVTGIAASGSGNISGSLTNTTFTPQTVTFTITPTANGCSGTSITATVLVNPTPNAVATPSSQTICSGSTITTIAFSGNVSGTTYNWTRDNTGNVTGIAASGSGNISGSLTNTTFTPQTVTFMITPIANGCPGTSIIATVLVNPTPNAVATPSSQTICSGSTITTIAFSGNVSGTTYNWTRDNTGNVTGIAASGSGNISGSLTNTTFTPQTVTFTITPTANSCPGAAITATVLVNPTPNAVAIPNSQTICSGFAIQTIVLSGSVSGTTFNWTRNNTVNVTGIAASGSGNISGTLTNTTNTPQTVTFTITPTANGCPGSSITATVLVNPKPTAIATVNPNPICQDETAWFEAKGGVSFAWSGPGGFYATGSRVGRVMSELSYGGIYTVTVTSSVGCTNTATVSITVNPRVNATVSVSPNPVCSGQTVQFTATGGTRYEWKGPFGFSSNLANPTITNVQQYHGGTYTVAVSNSAGCSKTLTVNLTVNQTPAGKISYDAKSTCVGSDLKLFAAGGATYSWTGPGGWTSSVQNPIRPNVNMSHSGVYQVVISSMEGCSVTLSVNITIRPLPTVTAWTTTPIVCEGSTAFLFSTGANSYSWSGPYGYTSNFQNPIIGTIPSYLSGNYVLTGTNEYGCSNTATVNITVQSLNAQISATPNPVPYGATVYLSANGGQYYQWTGPNGFNTTQQNPIIYKFTAINQGMYTCIISNDAGCQDTKMILINLRSPLNGDNPQLVVTSTEGTYHQVYPNPANDQIRLDDYSGLVNYQIFNANGTVVLSGKTIGTESIKVDALISGTYYIQWNYTDQQEAKSFVSRFVKTN